MSTLIGNGAKNDAHAYSDIMVTMGPVGFYGQAVVLSRTFRTGLGTRSS